MTFPSPISSRSLIALLLPAMMLAGCDRQSGNAGQDNAATPGEVTSGEVQAEAATGAPAKYVIDKSKAGEPMPDFAFTDAQGKDVTLEKFVGKPVLVNLWATWCAPCVAEMPQLDAIAGTYAKDGLQVLTISQDSMGAEKVVPFFKAKGFKNIEPWLDPENRFAFHFGGGVLPASVLYDAQGKEVARVTGALDWEVDEAAALLEQTVGG
ncbi:MAG: TlpA disulfide reductase family protein [Sphingobium sp.]